MNVVGDALLLLRRGPHRLVGRDPRHEVASEVGREVRERAVPERLNRSHDRRRVDVVPLGQVAGREKIRLLRAVQDRLDQALAALVEQVLPLGEAGLERAGDAAPVPVDRRVSLSF